MSKIVVIVCGGRNYADGNRVFRVLDEIHERTPIGAVVDGGADGADALARRWADAHPGVIQATVHAEWGKYGKFAGPRRNQLMMDTQNPISSCVFRAARERQTCDRWRWASAGC